jgi:hypothetical protein
MAEPQRGLKSRHIHIRHFWIKDRAKAEGIQIRHCPTLEMLGDFFTKPLQGTLFQDVPRCDPWL